MPPKVPQIALETAREKLRVFRTKSSKLEWKAFEILNADDGLMSNFDLPHKFEAKLLSIMEAKVRLPCVVCHGHQGVLYCSVTFTSILSQKERISNRGFKPAFYLITYPNESIFFSTRTVIPDVIATALIELYGGTRLKKLPLEGRDFQSLRQLHFNKEHNGMLCRRTVADNHPVDPITQNLTGCGVDGIIHDEDEPWKNDKNKYYRNHFYPEEDPKITKFTISSSSRFSGARAARDLKCDLKITFRSDNLLGFFDHAMNKGILSYPLNPCLENILNLGSTSIALNQE